MRKSCLTIILFWEYILCSRNKSKFLYYKGTIQHQKHQEVRTFVLDRFIGWMPLNRDKKVGKRQLYVVIRK